MPYLIQEIRYINKKCPDKNYKLENIYWANTYHERFIYTPEISEVETRINALYFRFFYWFFLSHNMALKSSIVCI